MKLTLKPAAVVVADRLAVPPTERLLMGVNVMVCAVVPVTGPCVLFTFRDNEADAGWYVGFPGCTAEMLQRPGAM